MKKYICMLGCVALLSACARKNDTVLPQHNITAGIEGGYDSKITITETFNGKTTQVYSGPADNPYKFNAPVGAQLKIIGSASYDTSIFAGADLLVTDNSNPVSGSQDSYNNGSYYGTLIFTIQK